MSHRIAVNGSHGTERFGLSGGDLGRRGIVQRPARGCSSCCVSPHALPASTATRAAFAAGGFVGGSSIRPQLWTCRVACDRLVDRGRGPHLISERSVEGDSP